MGPPTAPPGVPPILPPSVEEAYRRKCVQLRQRLTEVEEANDAARLRLARSHRGIEKMRLERAFLLEQLAKRTSTNVEDSEGSPSPPPTVISSGVHSMLPDLTILQPKEKPLRVKRGHRKPSFLHDASNGPLFNPNNPNAPPLSPSSESFSHQNPSREPLPMPASANRPRPSITNGSTQTLRPSPPKKAPSAWEIFAMSTRARLEHEHRQDIADRTYDVDIELASMWNKMDPQEKEYYYAQQMQEAERAAAAIQSRTMSLPRAISRDLSQEERPPTLGGGAAYINNYGPPPPQPPQSVERPPIVKREDDDVEMPDEPEPAPGEDAGGFTAINRSPLP